ncbi:spherical body protein 2 truncated copy 12, putative [Babesia ovis]|uniref:Spherical body protein 2 truncated copy 12, putative n=1 Tax=Babesia ovis TaxID=5869 RepID=A0A9W5TDE3_BABOV|nr:spherical body protein 2 truncated copy 12, putative [Babesia ovis]
MKSTSGRNNGFRKVAKWVLGVAAVAGVASGNVMANDDVAVVDKFKFYSPNAVLYVTSRGKVYTNQDIENMVDRTGLRGRKSIVAHELVRRRAALLHAIQKFDNLLQRLPEGLAYEVERYSTWDALPKRLADKITRHIFNIRYNGLIDKLSPELAEEALNCDINVGIPYKLMKRCHNYVYNVIED